MSQGFHTAARFLIAALSMGLLLAVIPLSPVRAQVVLDFEGLSTMSNAPGAAIPVTARLSDQFLATVGASFSSGSPFVAVVNLGAAHAPSGVNGIGGSTAAGALTYSGSPLFTVTFFDPMNTAVQAVTDFVSVRGDLLWVQEQSFVADAKTPDDIEHQGHLP